jgi:hypothetical protein
LQVRHHAGAVDSEVQDDHPHGEEDEPGEDERLDDLADRPADLAPLDGLAGASLSDVDTHRCSGRDG